MSCIKFFSYLYDIAYNARYRHVCVKAPLNPKEPTNQLHCPVQFSLDEVMPWFHVQFIASNALQFLRSNCRLSNVMENIHQAKMSQP